MCDRLLVSSYADSSIACLHLLCPCCADDGLFIFVPQSSCNGKLYSSWYPIWACGTRAREPCLESHTSRQSFIVTLALQRHMPRCAIDCSSAVMQILPSLVCILFVPAARMMDYSSLYLKVRAMETVFCMVSHLGLRGTVLGGCSLHAALDIGLRQQQKIGHPCLDRLLCDRLLVRSCRSFHRLFASSLFLLRG